MLCMKNNRTFYRKYAFGEDGLKLADQIRWIKENSEYLNLPEILDSEENETFCYYDMPYNTDAVGLFEYVHSKPVDEGWRIIQGTLDELERTIYQKNRRPSDKETIDKYIDGKVVKNLKRIKDSKLIRHLMEYSTVYINGVEYRNLQSYEKYLNKDFLYQIFKNDSYSVIHGDLTIENIICQQHENEEDGFYIIDPNTGNIHDSSNLDYGKLLQSIHGGYEFLMQTREVSVNGNHINFIFTKSAVYDELHKRLKDYMNNHMSYDKIRSVYFHEVVHWLRLMPYKISKDESRSLMFFAGFLMVLSDVVNMYGQDYEKELSRAI
jgi:hypothetical protein